MTHLVHATPLRAHTCSLEDPSLPDSASLAAAFLDARAQHTGGHDALFERLHALLPTSIALELCASPCSLRAGLLGLEQGRAFSFHERRVRMPLAAHLAPEVPVWSHGSKLTVWQESVLQEPKYYSFFVDAPLPVYNPNYRGKWRSHELLHGAVGFCWRPDFTRFDAYLAARLAELLPVVHWYGWDEVWRQRCPVHAYCDYPPLRECPACEEIASHRFYWDNEWSERDLLHATARFDMATAHFNQEWRACMAELTTRRRHETLYKNLNASRDAMGYVHGHWPRQSSWSFGAWVEQFLTPGIDYLEHLEDYAHKVLTQTHRLLGGELRVDPDAYIRARERRAIQDFGYRALYLFDYVDEGSKVHGLLRRTLFPSLEALGSQMQGGARTRDALDEVYAHLKGLRGMFPDEVLDAVFAVGHDLLPSASPGVAAETAQVIEGIASGAEALMWALEGAELDPKSVFDGFVQSTAFAQGGMLLDRVAKWFDERGEKDFGELARFEAFLLGTPRRDEEASAFALDEHDLAAILASPEQLQLHATLRRGTYRAVILEAVFEQSYGEDLDALLPVWRVVSEKGELGVEVSDVACEMILDDLGHSGDRQIQRAHWDHQALEKLLLAGVIWWSGR